MLLKEDLTGSVSRTQALKTDPRPGILGRARGIISQYDTLNKNRRRYRRRLWENTKRKCEQSLKDKTLLGEPDHPDTRTESKIREGSHTLVNFWLDEDRNVWGDVDVFDNPLGRIVWPMIQADVRLGFSTRGDGDLIESDDGTSDVDDETFDLHGVDFVINPSFVAARPTEFTEDVRVRVRKALTEAVESKMIDQESQQNVEKLLESAPQRVETLIAAPVIVSEDELLTRALMDLSQSRVELQTERETRLREQANASMLQEGMNDLRALLMSAKERQVKLVSELRESREQEKSTRAMMQENQRAHSSAVARHRVTERELRAVESKFQKAVAVIKDLRECVLSTKKQAESIREDVAKSEKKHARELKTAKNSRKMAVREAELRAYKKAKFEGMVVPDELRPLLERAGNEQEVDALVEGARETMAARFPYLPFPGFNSKEGRQALAEAVVEEEVVEMSEKDQKALTEKEDLEKVIRSQMPKVHQK